MHDLAHQPGSVRGAPNLVTHPAGPEALADAVFEQSKVGLDSDETVAVINNLAVGYHASHYRRRGLGVSVAGVELGHPALDASPVVVDVGQRGPGIVVGMHWDPVHDVVVVPQGLPLRGPTFVGK